MEIFNALNLSQITGGTKLKQGDFGSVLSYSLADENGQEITSFDTKTAYINLVLDDKILFTTTTQVDISRVTFHIDKAIPTGLYYLEIKIDDYIFPSDKDSVILIEEGATAYDLKDLVPNYDTNMTIDGILSDLSQKGIDITDLKTKMNAIYYNAFSDHAEIIKARGGQSSLDARLDGLDTKDTNLQNQVNTNKTGISNTNSRIDNLIVTAGNGNSGEINDLRVDINGLTHTTAGNAVRGQFTQIRDTLDSAVKSGLAEYSYGGETEYAISFSATTTNKITPTQAYTNEFVPIQDVVITKFRLDSYTTSTIFSIFILDNTNKLIASYPNLNPIISNKIATLSSPIEVPKGGKIQIAFLNGTMAFQNVGTNNFTEYRPSTGEIMASPIKIGVQWFYKTLTVQFIDVLSTNVDKVNTEDYLLPKFKEIEGNYGLVGRWFKKNNGSAPTDATNNQGSIIYTKVSGATQVTVSLTPFTTPNNPYFFAYSIDGGAFTRQNMTNGVIALPNNGEHIIQIVLDGLGENDPVGGGKWFGSLGVFLNGITVDAGEIKGILPKNKVGIYIGDSITEGINVLTTGAIGASNSATGSYTWISSKKLNAIPYYVGYGGTSTLGNASFHKAIEAIDYFYNGVKSNTPDVDFIVMTHGYNDNTLINNGTYTVQQYKDAYNGVMDRLKVKYSGRPIFCVVPFGAQEIKPFIKECIANRSYCYLIETDGISVSTTDGVHPNSAGSIVLGNHIADSIKSKLGTSYFID